MSITLLALLGLGTAFTFVWLLQFRERLRMNVPVALVLAVLHTAAGVLSVKVFAVVEGFGDPSVVGNLSLFGGVFFMPVFYYAGARLFKRNVADVFDVFVVAMVFTVMCARVNCIFAGCCQGAPIPGTDGLRWPTRELEIAFYVALLVWLGRKVLSGSSRGQAYPLYLISYGAFRFVVETLRYADHSWGMFHVAHIWAIIAFGLGLSVYAEMNSHKKKGKVRK